MLYNGVGLLWEYTQSNMPFFSTFFHSVWLILFKCSLFSTMSRSYLTIRFKCAKEKIDKGLFEEWQGRRSSDFPLSVY